MPTVVIQSFEVEKKYDKFEMTRVSGRVYFTPGEKARNIGFCVKANLYQTNEVPGTNLPNTDSNSTCSKGDTVDPAWLIGATYMSPDGASFKDFNFEQTWSASSDLNSIGRDEKYCAIVWALPDVCGDVAISPQTNCIHS